MAKKPLNIKKINGQITDTAHSNVRSKENLDARKVDIPLPGEKGIMGKMKDAFNKSSLLDAGKTLLSFGGKGLLLSSVAAPVAIGGTVLASAVSDTAKDGLKGGVDNVEDAGTRLGVAVARGETQMSMAGVGLWAGLDNLQMAEFGNMMIQKIAEYFDLGDANMINKIFGMKEQTADILKFGNMQPPALEGNGGPSIFEKFNPFGG